MSGKVPSPQPSQGDAWAARSDASQMKVRLKLPELREQRDLAQHRAARDHHNEHADHRADHDRPPDLPARAPAAAHRQIEQHDHHRDRHGEGRARRREELGAHEQQRHRPQDHRAAVQPPEEAVAVVHILAIVLDDDPPAALLLEHPGQHRGQRHAGEAAEGVAVGEGAGHQAAVVGVLALLLQQAADVAAAGRGLLQQGVDHRPRRRSAGKRRPAGAPGPARGTGRARSRRPARRRGSAAACCASHRPTGSARRHVPGRAAPPHGHRTGCCPWRAHRSTSAAGRRR